LAERKSAATNRCQHSERRRLLDPTAEQASGRPIDIESQLRYATPGCGRCECAHISGAAVDMDSSLT
jgi:hypothetical protein